MPGKRAPYKDFLTAMLLSSQRERAAGLLSPLIQYDARHNGDLVHTLGTYFGCNQNASRTAEELFLHRNGLLYRLNRVEELLGIPLSNREVSLAVELALLTLKRHAVIEAGPG